MTKRILFVGETQPLWDEFRALAGQAQSGWEAQFAGTGLEAMALLAARPFDTVVACVQLPDMNGADLLDDLMRKQPDLRRIVLSEMADTHNTARCIGKGHRHLLMPCGASLLLSALDQALSGDFWKPPETVQKLISRMRRVPSPPTVYFAIAAEMESVNASVEKVGSLIAEDPAMSARVLQLANSAVFGLQLQVIHPVEAVAYLGLETTRAVVLLAQTFSSFDALRFAGFSFEALWHHSVFTGRFARRIIQAEERPPGDAEQASAAGLMHDLGKLLLAANMPEKFGEALELAHSRQGRLWEAEREVLGADHAELGACLLSIWGLPLPIVEAVARHHEPPAPGGQSVGPNGAVHVANLLAHEIWRADSGPTRTDLDLARLKDLGFEQNLEIWRKACSLAEPSAW